MKISHAWLQNYFNDPLPDVQAVADALTFHAFEIDGIDPVGEPQAASSGAGGDWVLDVKVTPNRGHDCLSHRGIAKELSAILNMPLKAEVDPFAKKPDFSKKTDAVTVSIEDKNLCRRYIAGYITGVKVGPSPEWLKKSLESIGQRSINNIVDATNLVMFNIGQPLHAFDNSKLKSQNAKVQIKIQKTKAKTPFTALDDKAYELPEGTLVIADEEKVLGIAGVKGGKESGVTEATTDIIIESANFDGPTTRKTAAALKLRTDASARFEQVISPELAAYGMQQVVDLITSIAGGTVEGFVDEYPSPIQQTPVRLNASEPSKVLGIGVTNDAIRDAFTRLGFQFTEEGSEFIVTPPFERLDILIPEDLIEEIGRIVGYEKVPGIELPPSGTQPEINQNFAAAEQVRKTLMSMGYSEVLTSVFADKGEVAVLNKVDSVRPFLRANLTDGLNDALAKNKPNKDLLGLKELKLFEIGTVWKDGEEKVMAGIVTEKEPAKEDPLSMYVKETAEYEPLPVSALEQYKPFSRYPSITRDIAMWVPAATTADEVRGVLVQSAGPLCVRLDQFDEFKKGEKTSFAFRLVFQSGEKTLTDDEANAAMQGVYDAVKTRGWEVR